jgi:hypothetical protein
LAASGRAADSAGSYLGEAELGLWGGLFMPGMFDMRRDTETLNDAMKAMEWKGDIKGTDLTSGFSGGGELSWGLQPGVKLILAAETRGVSASGKFTGTGSNVYIDPVNGPIPQKLGIDTSYACWGVEAGITFLLKQFEDWSRIGVTVRGGVHQLTGAEEHWDETGQLAEYHWLAKYSGSAVGGMLGLEWEWLARFEQIPFAPGGFVLAGWRYLSFDRVNYTTYDSIGNTESGPLKDANDNRLSMDFSGPEIRFGLRLAYSPGQ